MPDRTSIVVCPILMGAYMHQHSVSRNRPGGEPRSERAAQCYEDQCGFRRAGLCPAPKADKAAKTGGRDAQE